LLAGLVDLVLVAEGRLQRVRRAPHLREVAARREFEDVEPVGAGDDELDEGLERSSDNSCAALR
jgi:hypothetical protein